MNDVPPGEHPIIPVMLPGGSLAQLELAAAEFGRALPLVACA